VLNPLMFATREPNYSFGYMDTFSSFSRAKVGNQNNDGKTDHNTDCQIINPMETVMPHLPHKGILNLGNPFASEESGTFDIRPPSRLIVR
jgi:hypothetical protein